MDGYIKRNGIDYVREKLTLTELEPRENAARYFMAALRDDFKLPVRSGDQPKKPSKRPSPPVIEEVPQTDEERRAASGETPGNEASRRQLQFLSFQSFIAWTTRKRIQPRPP